MRSPVCVWVTISLLAGAGCGDRAPSPFFPESFLFGAAIGGFQAEMGCPTLPDAQCGDPASDWFVFATSPETIGASYTHLSGENPLDTGPGHYQLFEEDLELVAQGLSGNAVSLTFEWSRVFPETPEGVSGFEALRAVANPVALAHYHAVLAAARQRGLTPMVSLIYNTLPTWLHNPVGCHADHYTCSPSGWMDRARVVAAARDYAAFMAREFGAQIDLWVPTSEAFLIVFSGFLWPAAERSNPPALWNELTPARVATEALVEAHARMAEAIREADTADADGDGRTAQVGLIHKFSVGRPRDPARGLDARGAEGAAYLFSESFFNDVSLGELDLDLDRKTDHRPDLKSELDFVGVDYYGSLLVTGTTNPSFPEMSPLSTFDPITLEADVTDPDGLYEILIFLRERGLPAYVTENGLVNPNDSQEAVDYLQDHLAAVKRAIDDGADVRGFFCAYLTDGFEWNRGAAWRQGMYAVEPASKVRSPRATVAAYRSIAQARRLPAGSESP